MRKLLDSKFLFIVALSLVVLIILGIGAFYLFNDDDSTFVKNGYVLNPLSSNNETYYFNEDTGYKENLSQLIVFKDKDNNEATVAKDSFLHYDDGSLSFLINGAILDLDSIKGKNAVLFYNVNDKVVIENNGSGYVIKALNGDINLKNFIGRISDNKYIVVGKLTAKLPGNNANISADYFEIVYADEGIVNIQNKESKYQVTAEGSQIRTGDIVIDLGKKKITKNDEDIMSITAITIDGEENIEVIPRDTEKKDNNADNNTPNSDNSGNNNNIVDNNKPDDNKQGTDKTDDKTGEEDNDKKGEELADYPLVDLKKANVGDNFVDLMFDVDGEEDSYTLKITNLNTNQELEKTYKINKDESVHVEPLSPNSNYLFTVSSDSDGGKYFQKVFTTNDFGISLEKSYATDSEIAYKVKIGKGTGITGANLTLYRFNEETKRNEVVKTVSTDVTSGKTIENIKQVFLTNFDSENGEVREIPFTGLDSNTIYTAVLDNFTRDGASYTDAYEIPLTGMTLKKLPNFNNMEMNVTKDMGNGSFKLALGDIEDADNAIINYTYLIYEYGNDTNTAIQPVTKTNASAFVAKIGEGDGELKNDTNYYYRVVIEYYDNEKYMDYVLGDSINFVMGSDPYITVVPDDSRITYNSIAASIYLIDNSCLVSMPGREKCNAESTFVLDVSKINAITGEKSSVFSKVVEFEISDNQIKYDLLLNNLQAGTTYSIEARAVRNDLTTDDRVEIMHSEDSKRNITTKTLSSFTADWVDNGSNANHVINLENKLLADDGSGTLSPDETAKAIKKVVLKLYQGNYVDNIQNATPIATKIFSNTDEFNIKENFYDNAYLITSDETFGLNIDDLKRLNDGELSEYYTISMSAYYDNDGLNEVRLSNNIVSYGVSPVLLISVEDPEVFVTAIANKNSEFKDSLLGNDTTVGYTVSASFDRAGMTGNGISPKRINIYVYDNTGKPVKFYINNNGSRVPVDTISAELDENNYFDTKIYMGSATDYAIKDTFMTRGNSYYIGYYLDVESDKGNVKFPDNKNKDINNDYGIYTNKTVSGEDIAPGKESAKVLMYIAKSTSNSITYRYDIKDVDKAIYKEDNNYYFYYTINDGEEHKVAIQKVDGEILSFNGDITITGLNNSDVYALYYKKNVSKTGEFEHDILNYYGEYEGRLFDGYYSAQDSKYNFKYEIINNSSVDNKVTIKILARDDMLNRILSYKVNFKDSKGNSLDREFYQLSECIDDNSMRCYSVDYIDLKNKGMKSTTDYVNNITVSLEAIYDNGLTGYDYTVGEGKEYKYMIMQNNNTKTEYGKYIVFTSKGQLTTWSDAVSMPKGYYTYSKGNMISYNSKLNSNHNAHIIYTLTSNGYSTANLGELNPKMISIDTMNSDNNTFSFSSITPKIEINKTTRIINGAVVDMTLSGADIDDFCEENNNNRCVNTRNGDKYLYVEVWDNQDVVGDKSKMIIPTVKIKVDNSNTNKTYTAVLDKVVNSSTYYYNVYAYLNVNNVKTYTQLFDKSITDRNATKTYSFSSLQVNELFHTFDINIKPNNNGEYSDKLMDTKINLVAYANSLPFNFDVSYAFCSNDDDNCGIDDSNSNIFKSNIEKDKVTTSFVDNIDISEYDLEFDKNYLLNIYAIYDYYDNETKTVIKKELRLNSINSLIKLRKLATPEFIITREADYIDGDYIIDFGINVSDADKTLNNGEYFIKLENEQGQVVGNLMVKDENDDYVTVRYDGDYTDYPLDASVSNKTVRIGGLSNNTKYTVTVYGKAYLNNYDPEVDKEDRNKTVEKYHTVYSANTSGVAFGSVLFSATEKSIIATFLGGSNFSNVVELNYTVGLWDNESTATFSDTYDLTTGSKKFEYMKDAENWRFVIDPDGMNNILGQTYNVTISISVKNPETGLIDYYDSTIYPKFADRVQYNKDK